MVSILLQAYLSLVVSKDLFVSHQVWDFRIKNPLRPLDPTAGIKCLRNGAESGNLLVGTNFDGQPKSFSFLF